MAQRPTVRISSSSRRPTVWCSRSQCQREAGLPSWSTSKTRCPMGSWCRMSHGPFHRAFYWLEPRGRSVHPRIECPTAQSRGNRVMAKHIEDLSQFLQSFGVAPLALLLLPVLITALARNVILALATSLLSFASLMLFVAPAPATSGLTIVSGLGSFLVALESVVARGRMMALNKEIADLTTRVDHLERAEQRRLTLEIKATDHPCD